MKTKNYFKRVIIMTLIFSVTFGLFPMTSEAKVWFDNIPNDDVASAYLKWNDSDITANTTGIGWCINKNDPQNTKSACVMLRCYDINNKVIWCQGEAWKKKLNSNNKAPITLVNNHNKYSVAYTHTWHQVYNVRGYLICEYGNYRNPIKSKRGQGY